MSTLELVEKAKRDFIRFIGLITRFDKMHGSDPIVFFQSLPEKPYEDELPVKNYFPCPVSALDKAFEILWQDNIDFYSANFALHEFGKNGNVKGGRVQENCTRIRCFAADLDFALPIDVISRLIKLFKPGIAVATSIALNDDGDKFYKAHFYWPLDTTDNADADQTMLSHWKDMQQAIAFRMEDITHRLEPDYRKEKITDKYITNYSGTLRLPGFFHQKNPKNKFRSRIIHADDSAVTPANVKDFFSELRITPAYLREIKERLEAIREANKKKTRERLRKKYESEKDFAVRREDDSDKTVTRYSGAVDGNRTVTMLEYVKQLIIMRQFTLHEACGSAVYEDKERNDPPLGSRVVIEMATRVWEDYVASMSEALKQRIATGGSLAAKSLFMQSIKKNLEDQDVSEGRDDEEAEEGDFTYDYSNSVDFVSLTSDVALANRMMQRFKSKMLVHASSDELKGYNEETGLWDLNSGESLVFSWMRDVFADVVKEQGVLKQFCDAKDNLKEDKYNTFCESMFSARRHDCVSKILRNTPSLKVGLEQFNATSHLLCCKNGIVDIETGELHDFAKEYYMTYSTGLNYRGNESRLDECRSFSNCKELLNYSPWTKYLVEVMDGDFAMCKYLQKIMGYVLRGNNPEELMFFLHGTGANGKSIFIETALHLLGDYSFTVPVSVFMENAKENKATIVAQLPGKRLISTSEVGKGKEWDEETIKSMSGVDKINARQHHEVSFQYRPSFKTFVRGNHKPVIRGGDYGVHRRIRLIPFDVQIPEEQQDHQLLYKLGQPEMLQQILTWAVAGHQLYLAEGLTPPKKAELATKQYFEEMNPIPTFISDCFIEVEDVRHGMTAEQISTVFNIWRMEHNEERMSVITLGKKLHEGNIKNQIVRSGSASSRHYSLKLNKRWEHRLNGVDKSEKVVNLFRDK